MLAALSILVLAGLILVPPPPVPFLVPYPHSYEVVENCAHPLIFALVGLIVIGRLRPWCRRTGRPAWLPYAAALGTAAVLGAATEITQLFIHRDCSLEDFINDLLGAGFAASAHAWVILRGQPAKPSTRPLLLTLSAACAVLIGLPLL